MCTKDSYGGLLSQEWTCVNSWKNPLREISCSRTNVDDRMMTACSVSAYRGKNYDENVRDSEVEFSERQRSFNGDERSGFSGGWLDSDGKAITRYVHGQNGVMPRLVSVFEASRGRKRKAEEETGFVGKHARVGNCRESKRDVKMSDADYRSTTPQSLKTLHDDRSVGHSSTMTSDLISNKEVSGRFFRSSMISSHTPKCTEVDKTVGRFVRTSMRSSFVTERTGDPIPVQWSTNSSASTNVGSHVRLSNVSAEMMKLPRNVAVQFKTDSADRPVVSDCNRSLQSPEVVKNHGEVKTEKSPPVLAAASLAIGQSNSSEASLSDVLLKSAGIAQHPSFIAQEPLHRPASEFRRPTPPSNNAVVRMTDATTNLEQGMIQVSFLPPSDPRESDNNTLHESVYGYSNTAGLPAVVTPSPVSEERRSEERLWRHLEPSSCEGDLLEASMSRNERFGAVQYAPFPNNQPAGYAEYNIEPGLLQSTRAYSGHNVLSPDYCTAAIPFQRMTIKNEIHQLQRQTVQGCGPNTSYNKKQSVRSEVYHWTEIPIKDQLNEKNQHVGVDTNPALRTREMNNRWTACQRENETKRLHRSKSLSPSVKSNVESGNFGSLQSIRTYYKTLGKAKNSPPRLETGAAEQADRCSRSQQVIECKAGETDMPIDLSSHVRKREQYDLDSTAIANNTTDRNIDCGWRRNTEISGGHVPQPRHVRSPEPGTILLTANGGLSDRSGVDNNSESPLQVPSPSISQPGSRLSSAACLPDRHLPPKKRRMSNYFSPVVDPLSTSKEVLSASTSPDVRKSPAWDHIHPASIDESLERETKTQLKEKTESLERGLQRCQWLDNGLEYPEDVRWVITPDEDGDLPLHIGVARGTENYVRKCVGLMSRLGASLDVYDSNRKTALQIAVITSQLNIVEILLRASASPNVLDRSGANSIHLAVKYGELDCLTCLLTQSHHVLDLDARNYEGLTALHIAVISNQLEAMRILLRVGASVNVADGKTGQTPLHYAAERNSQQMAKLLLVFGANSSTASYSGCTPAQLASAKSHLEMAKMLERSTISLSDGTVMIRRHLHVKEQ